MVERRGARDSRNRLKGGVRSRRKLIVEWDREGQCE